MPHARRRIRHLLWCDPGAPCKGIHDTSSLVIIIVTCAPEKKGGGHHEREEGQVSLMATRAAADSEKKKSGVPSVAVVGGQLDYFACKAVQCTAAALLLPKPSAA